MRRNLNEGANKSSTPEFVGFDHPVESLCDLLAYETWSESGSEPVSDEGSSGATPVAGDTGLTLTLEQIQAHRQEIEEAKRHLERECTDLEEGPVGVCAQQIGPSQGARGGTADQQRQNWAPPV